MGLVTCLGCGQRFPQVGLLTRAVTDNPTGMLCPDCVRQQRTESQHLAQAAASVAAATAAAQVAQEMQETRLAQQEAERRAARAADALFRFEQAGRVLSRLALRDPVAAAIVARFRENDLQASGLTPQTFSDLESKRTLTRVAEELHELAQHEASDPQANETIEAYLRAGATLRAFNTELGPQPEARFADLREQITAARAEHDRLHRDAARWQKVAIAVWAAALPVVILAGTLAICWAILAALFLGFAALWTTLQAVEARRKLQASATRIADLEAEERRVLERLRERHRFLISEEGGELIRRVHTMHPAVDQAVRESDRLAGGLP